MNTRRRRIVAALTLLLPAVPITAQYVEAISPDVVISQVYGGGGNTGATYTNDFVELFNRGSAPVSITGWSVQYASSSGTTWQVTQLNGTLQPGQYYLVQEAAGAGGITPLPTPDVLGTIAMSGTSGKVALVSSTGALSGSCPSGTVDQVGYGTANCFEGAGAAPSLSNTTAAIRVGGGCTETDDNSTDFVTTAPDPRNAASPVNLCAAPADPVVVLNEIDYDQAGTDAAEFVELKNVGTAVAQLDEFTLELVNGTGGGAAVYNTIALPATALAPGDYFVVCADATTVTNCDLDTSPDTNLIQNGAPDAVGLRRGASLVDAVSYEGDTGAPYTEGSGVGLEDDPAIDGSGLSRFPDGVDTDQNNLDLAASCITPGAANTDSTTDCSISTTIVINEIDYDQPGSDAAEFIELANVGDTGVGLDGWTLDLVNGTGGGAAIYDTIALPDVTLAAGDYFVVCANAATVTNCDLDDGPDTNFIQNGAPDAVGLSFNGTLIDAVSYEGDTGAPYTEGSGNGLDDPGADGSISRCPDGVDTGQNNADFAFTGTITPGATNSCEPPPPAEICGDPFTPIYTVQGSGAASPLAGTEVAVEGIVVGDFQNNASPDNGDLNGFHVQDPAGDGDPATSDGIFVFAPGGIDVATGDAVRVRGTVSEFFGLTEITAAQIWICSTGNSVTPTALSLPVASVDDFEPYEGMSVTFPQDLVISEYFNFDRFGEIVLTTDRRLTPTAEFEPGPDAAAAAADYLLNRITLDDGRSNQNPDPAIHPNGAEFTLDNLFRGGDTVADVTGVIDYSFGLYRVQPTQGADYANTNPRTAAPDDVGGNLKVSSFNVLNYFTTLDDGVNDICGPAQNQECRGADNADELTRQRDKIIAALAAIDADVVGLIEIENHPGDIPTADLVSGLNDQVGPDTYDYVATGAIGTDAIRVAIIYKPASVTPSGAYAVLDSSVDPRFDDTKNRPVLAQTFVDDTTGGVFTVAVNHLKSKGSPCTDVGDPDLGDGAGNCNLTRKAAAEALVDWLAGDPTGSGDDDVLIIGDLNSYDKEDPIDAIRAGADDTDGTSDDYTDLVFDFLGEDAYSYVFDGQIGYLDHALGSAGIADEVTGTTIWHINADEADLIDYDTSFKQAAQDAIYAPDPYRSSDHDPVIVGLDVCDEIAPTFDTLSVTPDVLWPPNHKYVDVVATVAVSDNFDADPSLELVSVTSSEPDDARGNGDGATVDDIVVVDDTHFLLRAERAGTGSGRTYTITYRVTDDCGNSSTASVTVFVPINRSQRP